MLRTTNRVLVFWNLWKLSSVRVPSQQFPLDTLRPHQHRFFYSTQRVDMSPLRNGTLKYWHQGQATILLRGSHSATSPWAPKCTMHAPSWPSAEAIKKSLACLQLDQRNKACAHVVWLLFVMGTWWYWNSKKIAVLWFTDTECCNCKLPNTLIPMVCSYSQFLFSSSNSPFQLQDPII